jgi:hypothetical protein
MMKYIISILLTALVSFIAGLYLPWWSIALAAFVVSLIMDQSPAWSFLSGFIGIFLLWEILAWWIDEKNNRILSQKIATVLHLGGSSVLLIFVTSLVGALVGGMAGLAGGYLRKKNPRGA